MNNNPFPSIIEIQFHNLCNSNCLICPYKDMHYKSKYMNDDLFNKFLTEIDDSKLKRLIPYLNNEPFIQKGYIDKLKLIRKKCPKTEIEISTNLSMLDREKISELAKLHITELRLSVFGFEDVTYKKMMPGLNKEKTFENLKIISQIFGKTDTIISIVMIDNNMIDENEFLSMKELSRNLGFRFEKWGFLDRSKNVECSSNNFYSENVYGCEQSRPIERMHILSNGDVILCCQDWKHINIMGNIQKNSIEEIWNSQIYKQMRYSIYNNINVPELCKNCKLAITSRKDL